MENMETTFRVLGLAVPCWPQVHYIHVEISLLSIAIVRNLVKIATITVIF